MSGCLGRQGRKECEVAVVGLDGAGKTTVVNALSGRADRKVIPTVGVNKARVVECSGDMAVKLFDLGGSASFRKSWRERLARSHAAVFVVDASSTARLLEVRDEFAEYLGDAAFAGKPVLILANKEDDKRVSAKELTNALRLGDPSTLGGGSWRVVPCVGLKAHTEDAQVDPRLLDGVRWLAEEVRPRWPELSKRVAQEAKALDKRDKARAADNKRSVALKRAQQKKTKASTVAPAPRPAPAVVRCQNKLTLGSERVPCSNEATQRSKLTGWVPLCDSCASATTTSAPQPISKLEAVAKDLKLEPSDESDKREKKSHKKKNKKKKKSHKHGKRVERVTLAVGDAVEACFRGKEGASWYPGVIAAAHNDGTFDVRYDDGDSDAALPHYCVAPRAGPVLAVGTRVLARFRGKHKFFPGVIESVHEDATTYCVTFDDGDKETAAPRSWILLSRASSSSPSS